MTDHKKPSEEHAAAQEQALFDGFEHLLHAGMFDSANALLFMLDVATMTPTEILLVLTITFYGKSKMSARPWFVHRAEEALTAKLGEQRAKALMEYRR